MNKISIVIASTLKPVDDTRMFEKFGISLGQTNKYDINIIGFCSKKYSSPHNIFQHPIFCFDRLSPARIWAPLKYFGKLLKLKPQLIIVTSPELLTVTSLYKILFGTKIAYDIRENYYYNIVFTNTYPNWIKPFLGIIARATEKLNSPFIDHFLLAESCYQQELQFIRNNYTIIENKYQGNIRATPRPSLKKNHPKFTFLYTGTISENYGIFQALNFVKAIYKINNQITFVIIGRCAHQPTYKKLLNEIKGLDYIKLIGGEKLVPHQEILKEIEEADFGLASYQPDRAIENKIPTKLYEFMARKLPIILQNHKPWVKFSNEYQAAFPINFNEFDAEAAYYSLLETEFYNTEASFDNLLWQSEGVKLQAIVEALLKNG